MRKILKAFCKKEPVREQSLEKKGRTTGGKGPKRKKD